MLVIAPSGSSLFFVVAYPNIIGLLFTHDRLSRSPGHRRFRWSRRRHRPGGPRARLAVRRDRTRPGPAGRAGGDASGPAGRSALTVAADPADWEDVRAASWRPAIGSGGSTRSSQTPASAAAADLLATDPAVNREMVLVNVLGPALLVKAAADSLIDSGGQIVLIGSVAGVEEPAGKPLRRDQVRGHRAGREPAPVAGAARRRGHAGGARLCRHALSPGPRAAGGDGTERGRGRGAVGDRAAGRP